MRTVQKSINIIKMQLVFSGTIINMKTAMEMQEVAD